MDVDMDDSLLSLVGDDHNTPILGDEPLYTDYESNNIRASLGSSDPVDENEEDEEVMANDEYDDEYFEQFDSYEGSVEGDVPELEEEEVDQEGDLTEEVEEEDADLSDGEFASKANDLAGVIEITEKEAKSLRQGPAITRMEKNAPVLELVDFKVLINHHLAETDWKYSASPEGEIGKIRVRGVKDLTRMNQLGESMKQL